VNGGRYNKIKLCIKILIAKKMGIFCKRKKPKFREDNAKLILAHVSNMIDNQLHLQEFMSEWLKLNKHILIIGQDSNMQIGRSNEFIDDKKPRENCIGICGIDRRDNKGEQLIEFLNENNLIAINTFFKSAICATFKGLNKDRITHQINHIISYKSLKRIISYCRVETKYCIVSNYNAVSLTMNIHTNIVVKKAK